MNASIHYRYMIRMCMPWFWLLVICHHIPGYTQSTDSLIQVARKKMMSSPEEALLILQPALDKAIRLQHYSDAVPLLHQLGVIATMEGNAAEAFSFDRKAMHYATISGDDLLLANSLTKMAKDFKHRGQADSVMACCLTAIDLYHHVNSPGNAWACYTLLADVSRLGGRLQEAEAYYQDAWNAVQKLGQRRDEFIVAGMLQHFYITTGNEKQYAYVLENLLTRHPYFQENLNEENAHYQSLLQLFKGDKAIDNYRKSIVLEKQLEHPASLLACMTQLGKLLTLDGQYGSGFDTLTAALSLASHSMPARMNIQHLLYDNRKQANDFPAALEALRQFHSVKDSINSENALAHIRELETLYHTREHEMALINEQHRVRQAILQRNLFIAVALFLIWICLTGIWYFRNRMRIQRRWSAQAADLHRQELARVEQDKKIQMMSSMIDGQEAERGRIARDLHDGLGGLMTSIRNQLHAIRRHNGQSEQAGLFEKTNRLIDTASSELRRITYNMMPTSLWSLGLVHALEDLTHSLQEEYGIKVDLQLFGMEERLSETTEIMLYRIVQELCQNVVRHARASRLLVQINLIGQELFLIVEDNGIGFDPKASPAAHGIGLRSIASRVKFLNGTLDIGAEPDHGTCMTIHIPDLTFVHAMEPGR